MNWSGCNTRISSNDGTRKAKAYGWLQEKVTDGKDVGQEKAAKAAERRFKVRVQETIQREILEQRIDMELETLTKRLFGSTASSGAASEVRSGRNQSPARTPISAMRAGSSSIWGNL